MSRAKRRRERRKRRQEQANLKHPGAKPSHRLLSGRTGTAGSKKNHSPRDRNEVICCLSNPKSAASLYNVKGR